MCTILHFKILVDAQETRFCTLKFCTWGLGPRTITQGITYLISLSCLSCIYLQFEICVVCCSIKQDFAICAFAPGAPGYTCIEIDRSKSQVVYKQASILSLHQYPLVHQDVRNCGNMNRRLDIWVSKWAPQKLKFPNQKYVLFLSVIIFIALHYSWHTYVEIENFKNHYLFIT